MLEKRISTATSTHARMQSPRMPPATYATLCKVVVRKQRDFGNFSRPLRCAVPPPAAADVRQNGMSAPPHSSIPFSHALAPPVPQKDPEKSGLHDEPRSGALRARSTQAARARAAAFAACARRCAPQKWPTRLHPASSWPLPGPPPRPPQKLERCHSTSKFQPRVDFWRPQVSRKFCAGPLPQVLRFFANGEPWP